MTPLPDPITAYVAANAVFDVDGMLAPFAPDAVVHDEKQTHNGRPAIRAWIEQATVSSRAIFTPDAWRREGGACVVEGAVAGEFPGSPVRLAFHFTLQNDAIARLEIG